MSDDGERGDGPSDRERVRFCMACGQIVAYEQRTCPSCGHVEPLPEERPGARTVACRACGASKRERLLHCPACGAEAEPPRLPAAEPWSAPPAGALDRLSVALALAAPAVALLALLKTVLGAAGTGG